MYPTLSHLIEDLFGIYIPLPIQTFGLFVALAFLSAAYTLHLELKRKENLGIFNPIIKKVLVGKPATILELLIKILFNSV